MQTSGFPWVRRSDITRPILCNQLILSMGICPLPQGMSTLVHPFPPTKQPLPYAVPHLVPVALGSKGRI